MKKLQLSVFGMLNDHVNSRNEQDFEIIDLKISNQFPDKFKFGDERYSEFKRCYNR